VISAVRLTGTVGLVNRIHYGHELLSKVAWQIGRDEVGWRYPMRPVG
jgi:hypothetical protein